MNLENLQENKENRSFRAILDYYNELVKFSVANSIKSANENFIGGFNNPQIKSGEFRLKKLDERYEKGILEVGDTEKFYIRHSGLENDDDKKKFFEIKGKIDELVDEYNKEFKSETPDTEILKTIYKKIEELIYPK